MSAEPYSRADQKPISVVAGLSFEEHQDLTRSRADVLSDLAHKAILARDQRISEGGEVPHRFNRSRDLLQVRGRNWVRAKGEQLIESFKATQAYEQLFDEIKDYQHGDLYDPSIRSQGDLIAQATGGVFAQLAALWLDQTYRELAIIPEDETLVVWNRLHPEARPQRSPFRAFGLRRLSVPDGLEVEVVDGLPVIMNGFEYTTDGVDHLTHKPRMFQEHKTMASARLHPRALLQMVVPADSVIAKKTDEELSRFGAGVMEVSIMHDQVKALVHQILDDPRRSIHFLSAADVTGYRDPRVALLRPGELSHARWQVHEVARREIGPVRLDTTDEEVSQGASGDSMAQRLERAFPQDIPPDLED